MLQASCRELLEPRKAGECFCGQAKMLKSINASQVLDARNSPDQGFVPEKSESAFEISLPWTGFEEIYVALRVL